MMKVVLLSALICLTRPFHSVFGSPGSIRECFPKQENHTLCHGTELLTSASSFAGLLRNTKSGYSVYQSNIWIILMHTRCHKDLERLLCTIYSPMCLKGHQFTRIYPCQDLCESIKEKCLPRMKVYGFEWPSMVDCSRFPSSREAECIQLTDVTELSVKYGKIKRQREDRSLNNTILSDEEERRRLKNCKVCHRKVPLELLTKKYCESSLVIKAKIVQVFNRPKNGISLRLHHNSKTLLSRQDIKSPLTNLLTEVQCSCSLLQGKFKEVRWLLLGDMENGQFIVSFLTKWRRKHRKFRQLMKSLKRSPQSKCKRQKQLLRSIYSQNKKARRRKEQADRPLNIIPFQTQFFNSD